MQLPTSNQRVVIRIPEGSWKGQYPAYVEEIGDGKFTVAHPMYGGGLVPLMPGDEVAVDYIKGDERLTFRAKVLGRDRSTIETLTLELPEPGAILRHQLRDFVRLETSLPLEYLPIPPEGAGKEPKATGTDGAETAPTKEIFQGRTINLSGSGAQVVTHEAYPLNSRIQVVLHLPQQPVVAEAEVVRVTGEIAPGEFGLGIRFTAITERDREQIVRYIFSEQRQRRQKGLL